VSTKREEEEGDLLLGGDEGEKLGVVDPKGEATDAQGGENLRDRPDGKVNQLLREESKQFHDY